MRFGDFPIQYGASGSWTFNTKVERTYVTEVRDMPAMPFLRRNNLWLYGKPNAASPGPVAVMSFPLGTVIVVKESPV